RVTSPWFERSAMRMPIGQFGGKIPSPRFVGGYAITGVRMRAVVGNTMNLLISWASNASLPIGHMNIVMN
ncbi:MAG: hypothetical protein Q6361_03200, partial [Candidatus Hermodarchaeota archaeon]|nr:hypothetical protein [Candidatus Hermodarchaeota archaeon]